MKKIKLFDALLALFFITYPFSIKLNSISIILLSIYSILRIEGIRAYRPPKIVWLFLVHFTVLSISAMFLSKKIDQIESILSFLMFPLIFYINHSKIDVTKVFNLLTFSVFIACTTCLVMNLVFFQINDVPWNLYLDWRYNNDFLSQQIGFNANYFTTLIGISIYYIINNKLFGSSLNHRKMGWLLLLAYLMFYLFLLSSRFLMIVIFLTCLTNIVVHLWKDKKKQLPWVLMGSLILVFLLSKTPVFEQRLDRTLTEIEQVFKSEQELNVGGLTVRKEIWKCATRLIGKNIITGVGLGNEKEQLVKCYADNNFKEGVFYAYDTHNQYLQSFLAVGILGFLITLLIFLVPFIASLKKTNILFASISQLFLLFAFTESILEVHKGIVMFCFFTLLICFKNQRNHSEFNRRRGNTWTLISQ